MRGIIDKALFWVSVPKCIGCGERLNYGDLSLCADCMRKYIAAKDRNCSRCAKQLCECGCSNAFLESHYVKRVAKVFRYFGHDNARVENRLVYSLKQDNRSDVAELLSYELYDAVSSVIDTPSDCVFTNVPRRKAAIKEYGIDHAAVLAKRLAKRFGAKYERILISKSKTPQKTKQGIVDRYRNVEFDYARLPDLRGKRVILVDDIITTGASVGRAAMLLHGLGAKKIYAAAIAIAYKDEYMPFEIRE